MKIAILSDSHDGIENIKKAVSHAEKLGAEVLFFCGDFCAPASGIEMAKFNGPVYYIFGNNDGDRPSISWQMENTNKQVKFLKEGEAIIELDNRKFFLTHYPRYADALARTGDYDVVCFGHDHHARIEQHGKCLAINPGCLNALRPDNIIAFAIYDTQTHSAKLYDLSGSPLSI